MASTWNDSDHFCLITDPLMQSNCYLLRGHSSCMIIDPNNYDAIENQLTLWKASPSTILLTHAHCDHIGALNQLRHTYSGIQLISSRLCSEALQDPHANMSGLMEVYLYYKTGQFHPYTSFTCQPADISFEEDYQFLFDNEIVSLHRLPGHSAGSCMIIYKNVRFSGDYLISDEKTITRLPGGNDSDYLQYTLPYLKKIPDGTLIYPGHGPSYLMNSEVRNFHDL